VPEEDPDGGWTSTVAAIDLRDGEVRWTRAPGGPRISTAVPTVEGWAVASAGDELAISELDGSTGEIRTRSRAAAHGEAAGVQLDDGTTVIVAGPLVRLEADATGDGGHLVHDIETDLHVVDVAADEDRVHLLVTSDDGAAVLTFALAGDLG
jgi:hypothetical protein